MVFSHPGLYRTQVEGLHFPGLIRFVYRPCSHYDGVSECTLGEVPFVLPRITVTRLPGILCIPIGEDSSLTRFVRWVLSSAFRAVPLSGVVLLLDRRCRTTSVARRRTRHYLLPPSTAATPGRVLPPFDRFTPSYLVNIELIVSSIFSLPIHSPHTTRRRYNTLFRSL